MIKLLQAWHWLHTWSKWQDVREATARYPWQSENTYAFIQTTQARRCAVCNKLQEREIVS